MTGSWGDDGDVGRIIIGSGGIITIGSGEGEGDGDGDGDGDGANMTIGSESDGGGGITCAPSEILWMFERAR